MVISRMFGLPLILGALLCIATGACDRKDSLSQEGKGTDSITQKMGDGQKVFEGNESKPKPQFQLDACRALADIEASIDTISANVSGVKLCCDDGCVLTYLDSLTEKYIRTGAVRYIDALATIYTTADGYIGEYYDSIWMKLMSKSPDRALQYICTRSWQGEQNLRTALKLAIASSVVGYKDSAVSVAKVRDAFTRYQAEHNVDSLRKCSESLWNDVLAEMDRQSRD